MLRVRTDHPLVGPRSAPRLAFVLAVSLGFLSCTGGGFPGLRTPATPREAYVQSLRRAGLDSSGLGRAWLAAGENALASPVAISLPFREAGYFAAGEAEAIAYRLAARRGQRIVVEIGATTRTGGRLFADLYTVTDTGGSAANARGGSRVERVTSLADSASVLTYEPERDGALVLRLQPELLVAVRYTLILRAEPTLAFPVAGKGIRAVQSVFGAERDGGRRSHEGVDIFAPRGTPALAAAQGVVGPNRANNLGGNVVWIANLDDGAGLYYAHLDTQLVRPGERVEPGDTVGLVGNTGNARTTVPQLHFGVYLAGEGAVNPYWYLAPPRGRLAPLTADTALVGQRVRTTRETVLRGAAHSAALALDARVSAEAERAERAGAADSLLGAETVMRVEGAAADDYRVRMPDGTAGYVAARLVRPASEPLGTTQLPAGTVVRDLPSPLGLVVDSLATGAGLPRYGRFAGAVLVRAPGGRRGWVSLER